VAVEDVSFAVERGEIFAILGPNGAGKTTAVEIVEGLRVPDRGTVRVLGLDPRRDRAELRRRVGVQLQQSQLPEQMKVWEALDLPLAPLDERLLTGLPEVQSVRWNGSRVLVTGTGDLLQAVTSVLARNQIVAAELRMEQASLDDAFMALTTHEEG
jgi:ABC-type branched-subunit amino acid transport system ATPase component